MKVFFITLICCVLIATQAFSFDTGKLKYSYTENGLKYDLSMYVPDIYNPQIPMPVIIALHASQSNSDEMCDMMDTIGYDSHFIIACPDFHNAASSDDYANIIYGSMSHVAEMFNIDQARVAICGYQSGGGIAVQMGLVDPVNFRGIIALAPEISMDYITTEMWDNKTKLPMGFILGENDAYYDTVHKLIVEFQTNGAVLDNVYRSGVDHSSTDYWGTHDFDLDVESILAFLFKDNTFPRMALDTNNHDFGLLYAGDSTTCKFTITNTGTRILTNFKLSFESNTDDAFSLIDDIKNRVVNSGDTLSFRVRFKPKSDKNFTADISIQPDTLTSIKKIITVSGIGHVKKAIFGIDKNLLEFDTVAIGKESYKLFDITNKGDTSFKILSVEMYSDPDHNFILGSDQYPITINGSTHRQFFITFKPKSLGRFISKVKVTTDLDIEPVYVNLVGVAKDDTTYVEELGSDADSFVIYPNPVKDYCSINTNLNILYQSISLHDIMGNTLKKINIRESDSRETVKISMTDFPAGIYFLLIDCGDKRYVRQVVKAE